MSECKFLLNAGHDEYGLVLRKGELTLLWGYEDVEPFDERDNFSEEALQEAFHKKVGDRDIDADLWWQHIYQVDTTRAGLERALTDLMKELEEDPGGDDGTFDYWPSGLRMAMQVAEHLGGDRAISIPARVKVLITTMRPEFKEELLASVGLE